MLFTTIFHQIAAQLQPSAGSRTITPRYWSGCERGAYIGDSVPRSVIFSSKISRSPSKVARHAHHYHMRIT